jgi:alkanesulfonate monooxygenase SsuD/methylene tetrahydromethanopterin reductase-like flavin-dependent oxidoreductase (luciferase family)
MRLVIFTEPQEGASYDDQLRAAQLAESAGYDGFFRSDHYLAIFGARPR